MQCKSELITIFNVFSESSNKPYHTTPIYFNFPASLFIPWKSRISSPHLLLSCTNQKQNTKLRFRNANLIKQALSCVHTTCSVVFNGIHTAVHLTVQSKLRTEAKKMLVRIMSILSALDIPKWINKGTNTECITFQWKIKLAQCCISYLI